MIHDTVMLFLLLFRHPWFRYFSLEFNHQMGAHTFVTWQHFTVIIESFGNLTRPPSGKQKTRRQRKNLFWPPPARQRCVTPKCVYCASWEKGQILAHIKAQPFKNSRFLQLFCTVLFCSHPASWLGIKRKLSRWSLSPDSSKNSVFKENFIVFVLSFRLSGWKIKKFSWIARPGMFRQLWGQLFSLSESLNI